MRSPLISGKPAPQSAAGTVKRSPIGTRVMGPSDWPPMPLALTWLLPVAVTFRARSVPASTLSSELSVRLASSMP